jgi:hypothetical protein
MTTSIEKLACREKVVMLRIRNSLLTTIPNHVASENGDCQVEALGHIVVHVSSTLQCNAVAWISLYPSDGTYSRTTILTTARAGVYKTAVSTDYLHPTSSPLSAIIILHLSKSW